MAVLKTLSLDILVLLWWIGLWNSVDILINSYIPPQYHLTTNMVMGVGSLYLYYKLM